MQVIKQTGTANTTYSPGRKIEYLAIHYDAGVSCKAGSASGCASWFANPNAGGSADYICDERYLIQYNPDPYNRYCHAVGGSHFGTKGGRLYGIAKNSNCVSLEICSGNRQGKITYPNDPNYYFTDKVLAMAKEAVELIMSLYNIDADHVIRHYDVNGKCCPGIIGWNADSGSEDKWNSFHESIGGAPLTWYRVRLSWDKPDTQRGAFTVLDNAISCANANPGFSVYDGDGKVIYTSEAAKPSGNPTSKEEAWINLLSADAVDVASNNGLLASVMLAQACLETGWGTTDLAKRHNIFGMKADLINSTWSQWSTWDGTTYGKYSPEESGGTVYQKWSEFRVYKSYRECMEDYAAFLLHVQNNKGYKYARIKGVTDPAEAIHIIRIGTGTDKHPEGYATDSGYEKKILSLIKQYNLTRFDIIVPGDDSAIPSDINPAPSTEHKLMYRVQVEADRDYRVADETAVRIKQRLGYDCFRESGQGWWRVYCGSFEVKANAEKRRDEIIEAFKKDKMYQGSYIKEINV